jgi:hypothetical protein
MSISNMGNRRNQNRRKAAANRNIPHNAQSHGGPRDEQVEGIKIKGGAQHNNQGLRNKRGGAGDWNESHSWSMSPEQSDPESNRSQPQGHDESRNKPPKKLADRMSHEDSGRLKQRASQTPTPAAQAPAKRKRTPEGEDEPQPGKKARLHGEMQSAVPEKKPEGEVNPTAEQSEKQKKGAKDLAVLKTMNKKQLAAYRASRFGKVSDDPKNDSTPPEDTSKDIKQRVSKDTKDTKDHRKANPIAKPADPVTGAPTINDSSASNKNTKDVMSGKQDGGRRIVPATRTRQTPNTKPATTAASDLNSSSSSTSSTPSPGRKRANSSNVEETAERESKRQKSDPGDAEAPSTQTPSSESSAEDKGKGKKQSTPSPKELAQQKRNNQLLNLMNKLPEHEEKNIEKELNFIDYGVFSIPLVCSAAIEHQYPYTPVYNLTAYLKKEMTEYAASVFEFTMIELRQKALYLSRQNNLTSEDLGRKDMRKSMPVRYITDCDLYLYDDKVHVATTNGLVLAADYLQLIGVPDEQPVRFKGHEPAWMRPVKAMLEHRRVLVGYKVTTDEEKKYGNIDIYSGSTVFVYERAVELIDGEENVLAFGARVKDGARGWFPYEQTCRLDWGPDIPLVRDTSVIDWTTFDYKPLVALGAARQAEEDAQRQAQVQALIQKDKAEKARERQAQQQAAAMAGVAPQVVAIVKQMSPIVMPDASRQDSVPPPQVAAIIFHQKSPVVLPAGGFAPAPRVSTPPAPTSRTSASPEPSLHNQHQATLASTAYHTTSRTTTASSSPKSEHSASTAASSQSSQSQEKTGQKLPVANELIARHDSPQARSDKAVSEKNDDEAEKNDADHTSVEDGPVAVVETLTDAFTKPRAIIPGFEEKYEKDTMTTEGRDIEEEGLDDDDAAYHEHSDAEDETVTEDPYVGPFTKPRAIISGFPGYVKENKELDRYDELVDWDDD